MTSSEAPGGPAAVPGRVRSAFGVVVAFACFLPFAIALLRLWQTHPGSAVVPLIFAAGVVICGVLALLQGPQEAAPLGWKHAALLGGFAIGGVAVWMRVPYAVAMTVLIGLSFGVIGGRRWSVMAGVWAAGQLLAYGVFKELLGIPIH